VTPWIAGVLAGYGGLLAYAFRLLFKGELVPRSHVQDWIEAYRLSEAARTEERRQSEELLALARSTNLAMNAIATRSRITP
jgi:urease accessory protein UreF